jgi:hypothetical protein
MRPTQGALRAAVIAGICAAALPAAGQERFRVSVNAGQQATSTTVTEQQTFQQYLEEGSFRFERGVPGAPFFDGGVTVRVWRGLYAGLAVSMFEDTGAGTVTARVPHPFFFNQQREVTGELSGVTRQEIGRHVMIGWATPLTERLDVLVFGGPSSISTEQTFATSLTLSLDKEAYPFDTLAFPGAVTQTRRESIIGYNAGADLTWRFTDTIGAGFLFRYTGGRKDFEPAGIEPFEVEVGGVHAGGGLRLRF